MKTTLETKFDIGQQVYYLDSDNKLSKTTIHAIKWVLYDSTKQPIETYLLDSERQLYKNSRREYPAAELFGDRVFYYRERLAQAQTDYLKELSRRNQKEIDKLNITPPPSMRHSIHKKNGKGNEE